MDQAKNLWENSTGGLLQKLESLKIGLNNRQSKSKLTERK